MINIDNLRTELHMKRFKEKKTLTDVSAKIGVSVSTLCRFEQGRAITIEHLETILDFLGYRLQVVTKENEHA